MTNEELQQRIERLEQEIINLKLKFAESKAENKPYEVEVPEDIDHYYYVDELGEVHSIGEKINYYDFEKVYQRGLAFETREEAEQFDKERILIKKLKDWAKEYQRDWTPNWDDVDEMKYYAGINIRNDIDRYISIYNAIACKELTNLPVLKSEEIGQQFIEEFGEEIKEVLC